MTAERISERLCLVFVWLTCVQYLLTVGIHNSPTRTVLSLGFLPSKVEYLDELGLLVLTGLLFLIIAHRKRLSRWCTRAHLGLGLAFILCLVDGFVRTSPARGVLYYRGELQSVVFAVVLQCTTELSRNSRFRRVVARHMQAIFVASVGMLLLQSMIHLVREGTPYLRDCGTGLFGGAHHAEVGAFFVMTLITVTGSRSLVSGRAWRVIFITLSIFGIVTSEFKAGLIFLPVAVMLTLRLRIWKMAALATVLFPASLWVMRTVNNFTLAGLIRSQSTSWEGSGGRLFLMGWTWRHLWPNGVFFGLGPGAGMSSAASFFGSSFYSTVNDLGLTGAVPQVLITISASGLIGFGLLMLLFVVLVSNGQGLKGPRLALLSFYAFLGLIGFPVLELQITSVLFWCYMMILQYEDMNEPCQTAHFGSYTDLQTA